MADIKYLIEVDEKGAVTKIKEVDQALDGLKGKSDKAGPAFSGMWKQFVGGQLVLDGLKKGFGALTGFIGGSITEAMEGEKSQKALETALSSTGRTVDAMLPKLSAYGKELEDQTIYSDDAIASAQALMVQMTNLDANGIQKAMKGAAGLASTFGIDLQSAAGLVAKAMEGNTGALARYGIKVDETLPKDKQREEIIKRVLELYPRATAETDTFSGRITQLGKAWDNVKQSVGEAITENETIKKLIGDVTEKINTLVKSDDFRLWLSMIADGISAVVKFAGDLLGKLADIENFLMGAKGYKTYIAQENEMRGVIQQGIDIMGLKKRAMEEDIIKVGDWARMLKKYGGDYSAMMSAIAAGKEGPELKNLFGDLKIKTDELSKAAKDAGPNINETGKALGGAAEKTKTLAEQLGIVTRIELEGKLKLYKDALDKYKDSTDLTTRAKDDLLKKIKDLEIELGIYKGYMADIKNELLTGVIPSTRGFKTELEGLPENLKNIGTEGKSSMQIISDSAGNATRETKSYFDGLYNDIASGFGNEASGLVGDICNGLNFADGKFFEHGVNFKKYFLEAFESVKAAFFRMIGEMVADKVLGLFKGLFSDIAKEGGDALGGIADAAGGIGKAAGGIASSLLSGLGAIGGIVSGIGAIFTALGPAKKQGDVTYWLKLIWENTQNLWNTMTWLPNTFDTMNQQLQTLKDIGWSLKPALTTRLDRANVYLKEISEGIAGLPSAQTGAYVARDALVKVHRGEVIGPAQNIYNSFHAGSSRNISGTSNLHLTANFYIKALDASEFKDVIRNQVVPELINVVEVNFKGLGMKTKRALGIA